MDRFVLKSLQKFRVRYRIQGGRMIFEILYLVKYQICVRKTARVGYYADFIARRNVKSGAM